MWATILINLGRTDLIIDLLRFPAEFPGVFVSQFEFDSHIEFLRCENDN